MTYVDAFRDYGELAEFFFAVPLTHSLNLPVPKLSGGQRARIALARTVYARADL